MITMIVSALMQLKNSGNWQLNWSSIWEGAASLCESIHTSGLPCLLTSICANEQTSPTPTTSTVKFLKKSTMSRDLYLKLKHKRNGVIMGLTSSWITNSWKQMRKQKQIQSAVVFHDPKQFSLYIQFLIDCAKRKTTFLHLLTALYWKTWENFCRTYKTKRGGKIKQKQHAMIWCNMRHSTHNTNTKQTKTTPL